MPKPLITYLVSSPYGDVPVDAGRLDFPLECDPVKTPYRVYFESIKTFLERDAFRLLLKASSERCGRKLHIKDLHEIIVRAEKHGALYHPASLELVLEECRPKFGLNVAFSEAGRDWLKKEVSAIKNIAAKQNLHYLPRIYSFIELETVSFLLEEWFEGYHEFHIAGAEDGKQGVKLWEFGKGYKYLSDDQSFEIYRQASKILTLYYDVDDFCQIYPWHHAAGDFIVKADDNSIDMRLTTARQYDPYMVFREEEHINPVIALFYFLLDLTVRMRLDRLDGVGESVWADDLCLHAAVKGFFDGIRSKDLRDYFSSDEFLNILKSFSLEDLGTAYAPLIDLYKGTCDFSVISRNFDRHVEALYLTLQNYPS